MINPIFHLCPLHSVMSGFQYFSQRSRRSSGATLRSLHLCGLCVKSKPDTTALSIIISAEENVLVLPPVSQGDKKLTDNL